MQLRHLTLACCALLIAGLYPSHSLQAKDGLFGKAKSSASRHGFKKHKVSKTFKVPKGIEAPVNFWHSIYSTYDRNQVLLHDTDYLEVVYDTIDLSDISRLGDPFTPFPPDVRERRRSRVRAAKDRVRNALLRLAEDPGRRDITRLERKIVKLMAHIPGGPTKYKAATEDKRLRSQTGLKDRFRAGIVASGTYMARIQEIFREEKIPWEITRLVFVESMFDLRAFSKVGASGIWQFMPGTARMMGALDE